MKRKRQPECRVGRKVHVEVARALRFLASRLTDTDCEMLTRSLRKVQAMGPTSRIWTQGACVLKESVLVLDVKSAYWARLMHMGIPAMDALRPAFLSEEKQFRTVFYGTSCTYDKSERKVNKAVQNMAKLAR